MFVLRISLFFSIVKNAIYQTQWLQCICSREQIVYVKVISKDKRRALVPELTNGWLAEFPAFALKMHYETASGFFQGLWSVTRIHNTYHEV